MANSSTGSAGHRNFVIKVKPEDAPRRIGVPTDASQWEGGEFTTDRPRKSIPWQGIKKLPQGQREAPRPGDRLYIWINKKGRGKGLTATAEVADAVPRADSKLRIQAARVHLCHPIGVINDGNLDAFSGTVFEDIRRSRRVTLRCICDEDAGNIDEAARQHSITDTATNEVPEPPPPPPIDVGSNESGRRGGQGRQMSPEERAATELHAMRRASEQLQQEGWTVKDKSRTESFDLLCCRGDKRAYAEVKGTKGTGDEIEITYKEVEFAREHQREMLLVVVSGIELSQDENGRPAAHGGTATLRWDWAPQPSQLRPISYVCTL